ncbi:MAG: NapC/NirT family cytochrome c [Anaerolineales bacterium]|nr:MAG: NapC/NirT family cytochrome c [Anaerolineales bacterium]
MVRIALLVVPGRARFIDRLWKEIEALSKLMGWLLGLRRSVRWAVVILTAVVLLLVLVAVGATSWEYTNSPAFCGTTCHTMPPEYTAYQISPHARVDCVDCHLGQDSVLLTVPRKAQEIRHVVNALTKAYEPPIYVKSLRPARDTCEKCHNPEKFSSDTFIEIKRYADNAANTPVRTYLIVKTGGGTRREGLGRGIHWHIENEVWFYSDDPIKQTIPYVREVGPDGQMIEYFDVEAGLPPGFGQQVESQLHRMDCIDCHTRISHLFRSPSDAIDDALARRQIDSSIPQIKLLGEVVLSRKYANAEEGLQAIEALEEWYRENAPDFYAENQGLVLDAIESLKEIFTVTVFPDMGVGWQTHPSNAGHREFPGCFRCHDGKHTSPEGKTVRLECNICHSVPEVVQATQAAPVLSIDKPGEPESHLDSNWLARHRYQFDETCAACHDVSNPGGTDNTSFCSNSACHAIQWKYVGLDAPAIRAMVEPPPVPGSGEARAVPHPSGAHTDCDVCHAMDAVRPFPVDHFGYEHSLCTQCHQPTLTEEGGQPEPVAIRQIPHTLEGRRHQCLTCHGEQGFKPYPADHIGRSAELCLSCHEVSTASMGAAPAEGTQSAEETQTEEATSIPHGLEGQDDCLVCHALGGAKPFPADHERRTADTCLLCHQVATPGEDEGAEIPAAESEGAAAPTQAEEPSTPEAGDEPGAEAEGPLPIPHDLEGRDDCLLCHNLEGAKPFPADHEGRNSAMCQACHQPAGDEEG